MDDVDGCRDMPVVNVMTEDQTSIKAKQKLFWAFIAKNPQLIAPILWPNVTLEGVFMGGRTGSD
jgi:hypothetical protein